MTFIVAIDGGAGSGKGTIAKGISKKFTKTNCKRKFEKEA